MTNFWVKGSENYSKALRTEYEAQRKVLQARLKQCQNLVEQQALTEELETLRENIQKRLREAADLCFNF